MFYELAEVYLNRLNLDGILRGFKLKPISPRNSLEREIWAVGESKLYIASKDHIQTLTTLICSQTCTCFSSLRLSFLRPD